MKTIFIVMLILIAYVNILSSKNNYLNYYTDLKLGDKIQLSDNGQFYDFHCLIFLDLLSCTLCQQSLINILGNVSSKYKIDIILFIGGGNKRTIHKISSIYPDKWKIIDDNLGAYRKFYKIKMYPFYLIANKEGVIIAMDKAGGNILNENNLDSILNLEKHKIIKKESKKNNLTLLKKINIENKKDWIFSKMRYILYSEKSKKFYIFIPKKYSIYQIDTNGIVIKKWIIPIKNSISFYSPYWKIQDTSIFMVNNSYQDYREYCLFNLIDKKITFFNINKGLYDSLELNLNINHFYSSYLNTFFTSLKPYTNSKLNKNFKNLILCNLDNKNILRFGKINDKFQKYKLSNIYYSIFYYDKYINQLLEIANLTDKLNFYNINTQKLIKTVKLNFNKNYKDFDNDYNTDLPADKKIELFNSIPYFDKIFRIDNNIYAISYFYVKRDKNNFNLWNWDYYIHFININLNTNRDIKILNNEIPFYVNNEFIFTSKYDGDNLYIKIYNY